jgi:RNA polymerase sigma factor (sigma-70 family)
VTTHPRLTSREARRERLIHVKLPPFQALLEEHRVDVYRYCVATAGRSEADDCFQETWVAALRAYPKLRRADNLRAWLFRIAHNKAMDAHRARGRRPVPVESVPERAGASTVDLADEEPELWEAVRGLPPKQRTAVVCRTVLGMPYEELARLLESSQDAARRNVFEGLRTLREGWTP